MKMTQPTTDGMTDGERFRRMAVTADAMAEILRDVYEQITLGRETAAKALIAEAIAEHDGTRASLVKDLPTNDLIEPAGRTVARMIRKQAGL